MTKADQLRALREAKAAKSARTVASKPKAKLSPRKPAKTRHGANGGVSANLPPQSPDLPPKTEWVVTGTGFGPEVHSSGPSFDRTAYQRVYCRLRRAHGPIKGWPADAVAELRRYSTGARAKD